MIPTVEHAGALDDLVELPAYLAPDHATGQPPSLLYSCAFCGVGDGGRVATTTTATADGVPAALGRLRLVRAGVTVELPATVEGETLLVLADAPIFAPDEVISGDLVVGGEARPVTARVTSRRTVAGEWIHRLRVYARAGSVTQSAIGETRPTAGCVKLKVSTHRRRGAYPIHVAPTVKDGDGRRALTYEEGIDRLARLLLDHRPNVGGRTLMYACGQVDWFAIFAMQEVLRILGVRNLTGNAEHCLNAGAVHNEVLTGQEGPFLRIDQALDGPDRVYLLNGWNGFVTHPPAFARLQRRTDLDAFLVEVQVTETAKALAKALGPEHVLLIRPRTDPHLALAVAHEILTAHPGAVDRRFVESFADEASFDAFCELALAPHYEPEPVAYRIAPEPEYVARLSNGIRALAAKFARPESVPINIPSVGLSQTSGIVAHCLWGCVLAMVGKYGLRPGGQPAGGTLRLPGQINAESEVQGLSRKYFFGRIPIDQAADAARRMGLPDDAYRMAEQDTARAALDYSDPTPGTPELFLFFGTAFEANMPGRQRWLAKLADPEVTLAVVDPVPDDYAVQHANLIVPSPPHPATTKVYQNGEWRMTLSVPQKRAAAQTRSDATILYDAIDRIVGLLEADPALAGRHPDLVELLPYLKRRFGPEGLPRFDGEVSRRVLWDRVQEYLSGGCGPLYCRPDVDGLPIEWSELLEAGSIVYGGVGTTRFVLDYEQPGAAPFRDIYRRPRKFRFFVPTAADLEYPTGVLLNSGRSPMSDERAAIAFATTSFNSGKVTPIVGMPEHNPLIVSPELARRTGLRSGDDARVTNRHSGGSVVLPVVVSDRVKGETCYSSFQITLARMRTGETVNDATDHRARCPYCAQSQLKCQEVLVQKVPRALLDVTVLDPVRHDIPVWDGQNTPLYVGDIVLETPDVKTFRFHGDPFCRFAYHPGQFCTLVLSIDGRKVVRSYSISSTPTRPYTLEITVKRVPGGLVSNWLFAHLRVGDRIEVSGPKGRFCLTPGQVPKKLLLVGAGSGVTPIMSMARWLTDLSADVDVRFFNCVKTPQDIIFRHEIDHLTGSIATAPRRAHHRHARARRRLGRTHRSGHARDAHAGVPGSARQAHLHVWPGGIHGRVSRDLRRPAVRSGAPALGELRRAENLPEDQARARRQRGRRGRRGVGRGVRGRVHARRHHRLQRRRGDAAGARRGERRRSRIRLPRGQLRRLQGQAAVGRRRGVRSGRTHRRREGSGLRAGVRRARPGCLRDRVVTPAGDRV